jgi:nucleotide-binding universal stress UspA family protein
MMAAKSNLLVPIDGSAASARGLREALRLARSLHAGVTLLHIVEDPVNHDVLESASCSPSLFNELRAEAKRILGRAEGAARRAHVPANGVMVERPGWSIADVIVEHARKAHADFIVMGTHGRRGMRRLVLGSDAEQVVRLAPVPVVLVRAANAHS